MENLIPRQMFYLQRVRNFIAKSWKEKMRSVGFHWLRVIPWFPFPMPMPFGGWWLAANDACSLMIANGSFENDEWRFVERFLLPGMTVLDIGAHHGYYTLLASRKVGYDGRVIAFEPSTRERSRLLRHLRLNRVSNVSVEGIALGSNPGETDLFLVDGTETGCNSLRPPNVDQPTHCQRVSVQVLDEYLKQRGIQQIDFVKLDAEGGELEILRGAFRLLNASHRPVILVEVQDIRTRPWGYDAKEIIAFLVVQGFAWYRVPKDGKIELLSQNLEKYDGNFVAVPKETEDVFRKKFGIDAAYKCL